MIDPIMHTHTHTHVTSAVQKKRTDASEQIPTTRCIVCTNAHHPPRASKQGGRPVPVRRRQLLHARPRRRLALGARVVDADQVEGKLGGVEVLVWWWCGMVASVGR